MKTRRRNSTKTKALRLAGTERTENFLTATKIIIQARRVNCAAPYGCRRLCVFTQIAARMNGKAGR